ncbi:hypothetical protein OIV83_004898 [Microbotryomycetes sp. JL201]|nr:hypothetical protein OIV83_004898 [Microbotryomycetes sp. JL201]
MVSAATRVKAWFTWKKPVSNAEAPGSAGLPSEQRPTARHSDSRQALAARRHPVNAVADGASNQQPAVDAGAESVSASTNRPPGSRRRRRRRRRSPSPVGLPLYSQEVHDDEMSLAKDTGPVVNTRPSMLDLADPSSDTDAASLQHPSPALRPASEVSFRGRARATSNAASLAPSELSLAATPPRNSVDVPRPMAVRSALSSPGLSPSSPPQLSTTRSRSSTLQSLFTRNRSSTLLSTSPSSSSLRGPYGAGSRFASSSTTSVNSQRISAPLQHTLVASSFVYPKSGPTGAQIAFLSSRDSLGVYGISDTSDVAPTYDDGDSATGAAASQGSTFNVTMPVPTRSHRASSVTSQMSARSSPLARQMTMHDGDDATASSMSEPVPSVPPILTYPEAMASFEQDETRLAAFSDSESSLRPSLSVEPSATQPDSSLTPSSTPRSRSPATGSHVEFTPKLGHQRLPSLVLSLPSPLDDSWTSTPIVTDGARSTALPFDFCVLVTDALDSPATFLLTLFVTRSLRNCRPVIFVGLGDTFEQYNAICRKSGVQLSNEQKNGRFFFIDGLTRIKRLDEIHDEVESTLAKVEPGSVIVIDDITSLLWGGNDARQVVRAVSSIRSLVSRHNASVVMLMHGDDVSSNGDSSDCFLFRRCLQLSDLWLRTSVLSSQTRGELSIHRGPALVDDFGIEDRSGPTALQYKLDETGPAFSVKGLGRMW